MVWAVGGRGRGGGGLRRGFGGFWTEDPVSMAWIWEMRVKREGPRRAEVVGLRKREGLPLRRRFVSKRVRSSVV